MTIRNFCLRLVPLTFCILSLVCAATEFTSRILVARSNTDASHFDVLVVLGSPALSNGKPTFQQEDSVTEATSEFRRGVAPRIIFSGGAAHNQFVEADVMAQLATNLGIPESAVLRERYSTDTIQNACRVAHMMQEHGWHSAEVIADGKQWPRAALIFQRTRLDWRVREVPRSRDSVLRKAFMWAFESAKMVRYLSYAQWAEKCSC